MSTTKATHPETGRTHRVGPRMAEAARYVQAHPGCTKLRVAEHVAPTGVPGGSPGIGYGYRTVDRAIRAGLIRAEAHPDHPCWYALYAASTHLNPQES